MSMLLANKRTLETEHEREKERKKPRKILLRDNNILFISLYFSSGIELKSGRILNVKARARVCKIKCARARAILYELIFFLKIYII